MERSRLSDDELVKRLQKHPQIKARLESLLSVVENEGGDVKLADDAEDRVLAEIQRLGREALQAWAQEQVRVTEEDVRRGGRAHRQGQKN